MGGVDLLDSMVACYRIQIRKRKWWFPFFAWSLSVSAVNAWRLMQKTKKYEKPFLDFLRKLVEIMMAKHGIKKSKRGRGSQVPTPPDDVRYDGLEHWMDKLPQRSNCRNCSEQGKKERKAWYQCRKCKVTVHQECFNPFHGR